MRNAFRGLDKVCLTMWGLLFFSAVAVYGQADTRVKVIPLSDEGRYMVDKVQAEFIIAELDRAEEEGYDRVILKIDTYGGMVFSARDIAERILRLNIPTTAFVETKAISAGAFIAWACDEIIMAPLTSLGDAQMITQTMEGIEAAPEKMVSVYRSDWEKYSDASGRSFAVARSFFEADLELLRVGTETSWTFILRQDYDALPTDQQEPILEVVCRKGELLTLHAEKAERLGLVRVEQDFDTYLANIGISPGSITKSNMAFNQKLMRFLGSNPWIYLVLLIVGLNGVYMEIKAPGFGIPGFTALVCFGVLFGARYFLGTASMLEMIIFGLGIVLCVVEIFVLPGLGIAGITGISMMMGALVLSALPSFGFGNIPPEFMTMLRDWSLYTLGALALSVILMITLIPVIFTLPALERRIGLPDDFRRESGYVMDTVVDRDQVLGMVGTVQGGLRPTGKMELEDGRVLDVVTDMGFVESGTPVIVAQVDGNRIVVRPQEDELA